VCLHSLGPGIEGQKRPLFFGQPLPDVSLCKYRARRARRMCVVRGGLGSGRVGLGRLGSSVTLPPAGLYGAEHTKPEKEGPV